MRYAQDVSTKKTWTQLQPNIGPSDMIALFQNIVKKVAHYPVIRYKAFQFTNTLPINTKHHFKLQNFNFNQVKRTIPRDLCTLFFVSSVFVLVRMCVGVADCCNVVEQTLNIYVVFNCIETKMVNRIPSLVLHGDTESYLTFYFFIRQIKSHISS